MRVQMCQVLPIPLAYVRQVHMFAVMYSESTVLVLTAKRLHIAIWVVKLEYVSPRFVP